MSIKQKNDNTPNEHVVDYFVDVGRVAHASSGWVMWMIMRNKYENE